MFNEDCTVAYLPRDLLKGKDTYAENREIPIGSADAEFLRKSCLPRRWEA